MELSTGLNVLYGLNGAGKSWALRALNECCTGLLGSGGSDFSQLIIEAPRTSSMYKWAMLSASRGPDEGLEFLVGEEDYLYSQPAESPVEIVKRSFREGRPPRGPHQFGLDLEDYVYEHAEYLTAVAGSTTLALVPTPSREPEWELWLCIPPGHAAPEGLRRSLEEVRAARRRTRDALEAYYEQDFDTLDPDAEDPLIRSAEEVAMHPAFAWDWHHPWTPSERYFSEESEVDWFLDDGLPIPAARLCVVRGFTPITALDEASIIDADRATASELYWATRRAHWAAADAAEEDAFDREPVTTAEAQDATEWQTSWHDDLEQRANELYSRLLLDAPRLSLTVAAPVEWLIDVPCKWTVEGQRLENLSRAEARWARYAVLWSLRDTPDLVVIDEPEGALHRAAEEHLARGLDFLGTGATRVVVATHSPALLDTLGAALHEVKRPLASAAGAQVVRGPSEVHPLGAIEREDLARLGLRPSDLLRRVRVFVLVEGEHDAIILRSACGDLLEQARADLIPIRGAGQLPVTVNSHVLFTYTDAHLVAVLDALDVEQVTQVWAEARHRAVDSTDSAVAHLRSSLGGRGGEYAWLVSWLSRALRTGQPERFTPLGLSAKDALEYLPVEALVQSAPSWGALRAEHKASAPNEDFKKWLRRTRNVDLSTEAIQRACQAMSPAPEELLRLGYRIRALSGA